jgi:hypothetical protein
MSLLRSICCLFAGRCAGEEPKPTRERPVSGDLGQKEAELEKAKEEELRRMESGETDR